MAWRWAVGAWTACAAAAGFTLCDPASDRIATAVISIDLIDGIDRAATWQITDHARLKPVTATVPGLTNSRSCDAKDCERSKEGEYLFHDVELGVRELSTQLRMTYSARMKIFFPTQQTGVSRGFLAKCADRLSITSWAMAPRVSWVALPTCGSITT